MGEFSPRKQRGAREYDNANLELRVNAPARYIALIEIIEPIQCPYCGQMFDLAVDTSVASQRFTTDCEICCRPMRSLSNASRVKF